MPTIRQNAAVVTQINTFTVPPGGQDALVALLTEAAEFAKTVPGWLSASIHRSLDGTRVVNYAQSENLEAAQRIITALREAGFFERNKALGEAHPGLYEVSAVLER
jgi:hypothetical protein